MQDNFLRNLDRHCLEGIVISWAVPKQYGLAHVNEKPNQDVISIFYGMNYAFDMNTTQLLRNSVGPSCPWFRKSLMVFRKQ